MLTLCLCSFFYGWVAVALSFLPLWLVPASARRRPCLFIPWKWSSAGVALRSLLPSASISFFTILPVPQRLAARSFWFSSGDGRKPGIDGGGRRFDDSHARVLATAHSLGCCHRSGGRRDSVSAFSDGCQPLVCRAARRGARCPQHVIMRGRKMSCPVEFALGEKEQRTSTPSHGHDHRELLCCGATANGLVGTHLIPHAIDVGFPRSPQPRRSAS